MKRRADGLAEVAKATSDSIGPDVEPVKKKQKLSESSSSDGEYSSNYITGLFVNQQKKQRAKRKQLLAISAKNYIPVTYTSVSTSSATATFPPIRTLSSVRQSTSIIKPIPTIISKPVAKNLSGISKVSTISKSNLTPSGSSRFKPISKHFLPTLKEDTVTDNTLENMKTASVNNFSNMKRSQRMGPIDTLQLIRNAERKFLKVSKSKDLSPSSPVKKIPSEPPAIESPKNIQKDIPEFKFRMPVPLTDISYLDSEDYRNTLKSIASGVIAPKEFVEGGTQTDDVIIQESNDNHLTCINCLTNLNKDNIQHEIVVKCQECFNRELPPSTNVVKTEAGKDNITGTDIIWICNECKRSKDEIKEKIENDTKIEEEKREIFTSEIVIPKIPDEDKPNYTPAKKMTNDIVPSLIAGEWTCEVCNSFNDEQRIRCFCCEAHKPGTDFLLDEVNKALKKRLESTTEEDESEELVVIPHPEPVLYKPIPIMPLRVNTNATVSVPQLTPPISPTILQAIPEIPAIPEPKNPNSSESENPTTPTTDAQKLSPGVSMDEEPFPQTPAVVKAPPSTEEPTPTPAPAVFSFGKSLEKKETKTTFQPPTINPALFKFGSTNDSSNMFGQQPSSPFTFTMGNASAQKQTTSAPMYRNVAKKPHAFGSAGSAQKMRKFSSNQIPAKPNVFEPPPFGGSSMFSPANTMMASSNNIMNSPIASSNMMVSPDSSNMMMTPPVRSSIMNPLANNMMNLPASSNVMMTAPMQRSISFGNIAPVAPIQQSSVKPAAFNFGANRNTSEEPIHKFFSGGSAQNSQAPGAAPVNRKYRRATRRMPR